MDKNVTKLVLQPIASTYSYIHKHAVDLGYTEIQGTRHLPVTEFTVQTHKGPGQEKYCVVHFYTQVYIKSDASITDLSMNYLGTYTPTTPASSPKNSLRTWPLYLTRHGIDGRNGVGPSWR